MLHFAFRLAVTPLDVDMTRCMFSSSSDKTIMVLIISGAPLHEPTVAEGKHLCSQYSCLLRRDSMCHVAHLLSSYHLNHNTGAHRCPKKKKKKTSFRQNKIQSTPFWM